VSWRPTASLDALRVRARCLAAVRAFFADRDVLEVETPILQPGANLDHGVVPMHTAGTDPRYLPTSPEHPLKRLIAAGSGPVWTLSPAVRVGERGARHAPEFRMLEWYRPGWDDRALAVETVDLLAAVTGLGGPVERLSWREAFRRHAGLDPATADDGALRGALGADAPPGTWDPAWAWDALLVRRVEPHLGRGQWTVLCDYPAAACAQARVVPDAEGRMVAARFEVYRDGIELANGYDELTDVVELRRRLVAEQQTRAEPPALDERFLAAMAAGLGPCAGVAVGFDRAVMLAAGATTLAEVIAFADG
jgi:elongation factor P--(R)-beta-lysine ligase